jgi:cysteine desulfurase
MSISYLDHAASAPMSDACRNAMLPWLGRHYGNPSGSHSIARAAREAIEDARDQIAAILGAAAREIVFTGGGTEAINLAIVGTARPHAPGTIITSAIEHDAVREAAAARMRAGENHIEAPVDKTGVLDLDAFATLLTPGSTGSPGSHGSHGLPGVRLVAVMAVNNEIGTIQPIGDVISMTRVTAPGALVLVDAVQGAAWLDPVVFSAADLVVISAHKFGGPQGVGALRVREGTAITPILHGGGQERERRSGTQNVAGIVGMAAALGHTHSTRVAAAEGIAEKRNRLVDGLLAAIPDSIETSPRNVKVVGNAHLCIAGVESESLLVLLDDGGVCASAGSACASGAIHTSPVLAAMGVPDAFAGGALRLTLGPSTTDADVDVALAVIGPAVAILRG